MFKVFWQLKHSFWYSKLVLKILFISFYMSFTVIHIKPNGQHCPLVEAQSADLANKLSRAPESEKRSFRRGLDAVDGGWGMRVCA